ASGKEITHLVVPARDVWAHFRALAFSADGTMLAAAAIDELRAWHPRTGKEVKRIPLPGADPLALAFSPDGKVLAAADGTIRLFDVASGKEALPMQGLRGPVTSVALTPDGRSLATRSGEGTILWDIATGRERLRLSGGPEPRLHLADNGRTLFSTGPGK